MTKAVFFDVGNTLIHTHPSVGEIYAQIGRRHGMALEPSAVNQGFRRAFMRYGTAPLVDQGTEVQWWKRIVREAVCQGLAPEAFNSFFEDLYDHFTRAEAWRLYPDVLPALDALKARGVTLGVISNWDSRLIPTLENLGLSPYFSVIAVSALVGHAKPDPGIFFYALEKTGMKPEEGVHVGDNPELDCLGAARCGMKALLIDRAGGSENGGPCGAIGALTEVEAHLG